MKYWIGSEAAIIAAEAQAAAIVTAQVAHDQDGNEVPNPLRFWAVPMQEAGGQWVIPAYPEMDTPEECDIVENVECPA